MKLFKRSAYCIAALAFSASIQAAEHGSPDDAVALVKKAVTYIKTHGQEKAFAEFNKSSSAFKDRDLYIVVGDLEGNMLAHGGNPRIVGKAMMNIRDADGRYFVQEIYALANAKGKGWVNYKWVDPVSSAIEHKASYFEKAGDIIVLCGVYQQI